MRNILLGASVCLAITSSALAQTAEQTQKAPPSSGTAPQASPKYAPGWIVELRTASLSDGKLVDSGGNIAAFIEAGPAFTEAAFVKRSNLGASNQIVIGGAAAKFVARDNGTYQLGVKFDVDPEGDWNHGCNAKLQINDTVIVDRTVTGKGQINMVAISPVVLSKGLYDVVLRFGCYKGAGFWGAPPQQTASGKITILVSHTDELAAAPARAGDFVYPVSEQLKIPNAVRPGSAPSIAPKQHLPSGTQSWYYCDNPKGYYPYVSSCSSGWRQVPARP